MMLQMPTLVEGLLNCWITRSYREHRGNGRKLQRRVGTSSSSLVDVQPSPETALLRRKEVLQDQQAAKGRTRQAPHV